MPLTLLGKKLGMTRTFTSEGASVPVTVIEAGPCVVTQIKTTDNDGYAAVQIGFDEVKARRSTIPMIGHDAKAGAAPMRRHREFRVAEKDLGNYTVGQNLTVNDLAKVAFVDVSGTSKGHGFTGVMVRHNFKGMFASHGCERKHRHGGSIGSHASWRGNGQIALGKKMPGQFGNARVTVRSLEVVRIDADRNLILVKGPVPGPNKGDVEVRIPTRLYKSKSRKQAEKAKS